MLTKQGTITSAKMQNTVTVTVHRSRQHALYKKSFRVSKKFLADTNNMTDLAIGDIVIIEECRPLSKLKHFKVKEVVKRVPRVSEIAEEAGLEQAIHREKKDMSHESRVESDETQDSKLETSRSQS
jgi:small subunit ribosomal protein S17